jgi:hypothetical protein
VGALSWWATVVVADISTCKLHPPPLSTLGLGLFGQQLLAAVLPQVLFAAADMLTRVLHIPFCYRGNTVAGWSTSAVAIATCPSATLS